MSAAFRHGFVTGKFYPPHPGHVHLIRVAAEHCHTVTVAVLAGSRESIDPDLRVRWLREAVAECANIVWIADYDDVRFDLNDAAVWAAHVAVMRRAIGAAEALRAEPAGAPDAVFSSEAYGDELARRLGATPVTLDPRRPSQPLHARKIRADPIHHWEHLLPAVAAYLCRRVVVLGAESSGTTTLARQLTAALRTRGGIWERTQYVAEFGREASMVKLALARACARRDGAPLPQLGDLRWNEDEFVAIAARQTAIEDAAARFGGPVLVCDTDAWATNVWHERYIGYESEPVKAIAAKLPRRALYLLTDHRGVPFEDDGLRDGLHLRNWMTERFRAQLAAAQLPWCELRGDAATRLNTALAEVDAVLARGWSFGPTPERGAT